MSGGIYFIRNKVDGKRYIGRAADFAVRKRKHWQRLRIGTHYNPKLQAAWNKYGEAAFEFVEHCVLAPEQQETAEQIGLDLAIGEYNLSRSAATPMRVGDKHSDETRAKMSAARTGRKHSDEARAKISATMAGRKHSDEHRAKNSAAKVGKKPSDETRAKYSVAWTPERRAAQAEKMRATNTGRKDSAETIAKRTAACRELARIRLVHRAVHELAAARRLAA